ncbi:MAG: TPM domain-containing protein [Bacteroidales bacterium]|nr:TPM domain-containing protein [Bacteroidales bacterium]
MKRIFSGILTILLFMAGTHVFASLPGKPNPPRLVNDFSGLLKGNEVMQLEQKLVNFNNQTTTQISIVIIDDLEDYEPSEYADRLAEKWGVGGKEHNNGVLVLVKPKTMTSKGQVYITVGYGLESIIPDATAKLIVENEILPHFRNDNYYQGLDAGTNTLMKLALKEFTATEYADQVESPGYFLLIPIIFIILFFVLSRKARNSHYHAGKGMPLGSIWWLLSQGSRGGSGSWGNFNSGSGPFSGGGGFGGFGGGRFGGGGAGGSW